MSSFKEVKKVALKAMRSAITAVFLLVMFFLSFINEDVEKNSLFILQS